MGPCIDIPTLRAVVASDSGRAYYFVTLGLFTLQRRVGAMARSDGARQWAIVLSELADVRVVVEWERPSWRVRWTDGPTRLVLMDRAAALSQYGVGTPLHARDMLFFRSSSGLARALAWLTMADQADRRETVDLVEQAVED